MWLGLRYDERRADWEKYRDRRLRLRNLQKLAGDLALALCSLDLLSRDDLESRIGREKIDYLNGLLLLLNQHAGALESETQVRGNRMAAKAACGGLASSG